MSRNLFSVLMFSEKYQYFFANVLINALQEKGIHYIAISIVCPVLSSNILKA